ncbi:MAG: folate-binding protein YgfZ [Caulobacterales bacterium]|nr:folate-binding protein YgfZ [Caulobacterales bacterium]
MTRSALLSSRAVLKITGPDARSFLQGVLTQDVEQLPQGSAAFSALLTPQGKILFDFLLLATTEGFLVDCPKESAEPLRKRLTMYRLRAKATIEATDLAVAAFWDEAPRDDAFADPRLPALGMRKIAPASSISASADENVYDLHRLSLGVPEFIRDFGAEEVFLTDVDYDVLNGVNYKKGCFVGQEVTSRMKRKGEIRKRTVKLAFEGAQPAKGESVMGGEAPLGEVMSGAEGLALALIRLDRLEAARAAGAPITAGGKHVQIIVPDWLEQA